MRWTTAPVSVVLALVSSVRLHHLMYKVFVWIALYMCFDSYNNLRNSVVIQLPSWIDFWTLLWISCA